MSRSVRSAWCSRAMDRPLGRLRRVHTKPCLLWSCETTQLRRQAAALYQATSRQENRVTLEASRRLAGSLQTPGQPLVLACSQLACGLPFRGAKALWARLGVVRNGPLLGEEPVVGGHRAAHSSARGPLLHPHPPRHIPPSGPALCAKRARRLTQGGALPAWKRLRVSGCAGLRAFLCGVLAA